MLVDKWIEIQSAHAECAEDSNYKRKDRRYCKPWFDFRHWVASQLSANAYKLFGVLEGRCSVKFDYEIVLTQETLCAETGIKHHMTVSKAATELVEAGIIEILPPSGQLVDLKTGKQARANRYRLLILDIVGDFTQEELGAYEQPSKNDPINFDKALPKSGKPSQKLRTERSKIDYQPGIEESKIAKRESEIDSILTCTNSTNINKFNPNGLNGVAAEGQTIKSKIEEIAPTAISLNSTGLANELQTRLDQAQTAKERTSVIFEALRLARGQQPDKADYSGTMSLINQHGCDFVLKGILVTVGKQPDHSGYFPFLRGVINRLVQQQQQQSQNRTRQPHQDSTPEARQAQADRWVNQVAGRSGSGAPLNSQLDLSKYLPGGKYGPAVAAATGS